MFHYSVRTGGTAILVGGAGLLPFFGDAGEALLEGRALSERAIDGARVGSRALAALTTAALIVGGGIGLGKTLQKHDPSGKIAQVVEKVSIIGALAFALTRTVPSCAVAGVIAAGWAAGRMGQPSSKSL